MKRRQFTASLLAGGAAATVLPLAYGLTLSDADATAGVRAALEQGASVAVGLLGKTDGFLGNPKVRIPLPGYLDNAGKLLRTLGQQKRVDELVTAMNRAAEAAVPEAKALLVEAVKSMSVQDATHIITGGDDSVTRFFAAKTRQPLGVKFLPIVTQATQKVSLAAKYNAVASKAAGMGLMNRDDASIEQYVTGKALDGLYLMIGEEEKKIRQNPAAAGSAILTKVFGALK